jgi:L-seryl-tRNA(Ser) seleniumtransferase
MKLAELRQRAEALAGRLRAIPELSVSIAEDVAYVGGGSLPDQSLPSWVVEVEASRVSDQELARRLRLGDPAVMGRLRDGRLVLDVRTVFPEQEADLAEALRQAAGAGPEAAAGPTPEGGEEPDE